MALPANYQSLSLDALDDLRASLLEEMAALTASASGSRDPGPPSDPARFDELRDDLRQLESWIVGPAQSTPTGGGLGPTKIATFDPNNPLHNPPPEEEIETVAMSAGGGLGPLTPVTPVGADLTAAGGGPPPTPADPPLVAREYKTGGTPGNPLSVGLGHPEFLEEYAQDMAGGPLPPGGPGGAGGSGGAAGGGGGPPAGPGGPDYEEVGREDPDRAVDRIDLASRTVGPAQPALGQGGGGGFHSLWRASHFPQRFQAGVEETVAGDRPGGGVGEGQGAMGASQTFAGVGQGAGQTLASFGNLMGPEVAIVGNFVSALSGASDELRDWIKGLHQANMEFAEFSAAMADVKATQQAREMELAMERGDRRADSARELADAMHEMNVEFAKGEDRLANAFNKVGAGLAVLLTDILKTLNDWLPDRFEQNNQGGTTINEQVQQTEPDMTKFGRPDRF